MFWMHMKYSAMMQLTQKKKSGDKIRWKEVKIRLEEKTVKIRLEKKWFYTSYVSTFPYDYLLGVAMLDVGCSDITTRRGLSTAIT